VRARVEAISRAWRRARYLDVSLSKTDTLLESRFVIVDLLRKRDVLLKQASGPASRPV